MKRIGHYLCLLPMLLLAFPDLGIGQEQEISVLNAKIKKAKNNLSKIEKKIDAVREEAADSEKQAEKAKQVQSSINELSATKSDGETKAEGLETALIKNYKLLKAYQDHFRYSTELSKGDVLGDVTLKDGSKYSSAVFSGASNIGIQISHSGGVGNVPYDQLPTEVAAKFTIPPVTQTTIDVSALLASKASFSNEGDDATASAEVNNSPAANSKLHLTEAEKEREAKEQKNAEIGAKLDALDEKFKVVQAALTAQEIAKRGVIHEQKVNRLQRRTAKSDADMARITDAYDQKISALAAQREALLSEIKTLREQRTF